MPLLCHRRNEKPIEREDCPGFIFSPRWAPLVIYPPIYLRKASPSLPLIGTFLYSFLKANRNVTDPQQPIKGRQKKKRPHFDAVVEEEGERIDPTIAERPCELSSLVRIRPLSIKLAANRRA